MSKDNGGPAFPVEIRNTTEESFTGCMGEEVKPNSFSIYSGISVRDYFAAKAMQGICAHPDTWGRQTNEIAQAAYELADAMLAAGAKP